MLDKNYILTKEVAQKKLQRMAYEIVERNAGESPLILAGIKDSGLIIAKKIKDFLQPIFKGELSLIEISLDKRNPTEINISPSIDLNDKIIIVTDDVVNSGKTLLYALKPFLSFHVKKIQTLVLVERTHKAFPVTSDYVGLSVATTVQEHIVVETEGGEILGAYLI
ncbi:MAG: phosphoribosyltransferase [Chitinophagaceae bacterium]|nr:phosphoribosyltransferase [Chitinophagaceae bacterium]